MTARCSFCSIVAGDLDAEIVLDTPAVVAFLDHRPLFDGHTLVVPRNRKDGLRGFFWPRHRYESDATMTAAAAAIRRALARSATM